MKSLSSNKRQHFLWSLKIETNESKWNYSMYFLCVLAYSFKWKHVSKTIYTEKFKFFRNLTDFSYFPLKIVFWKLLDTQNRSKMTILKGV